MAVLASVDDFLEVIKKSNLLESGRLDREIEELTREQAMPVKPSQLAAVLVRRGLLTNFQATQLVNGRWHGFFIGGKYKLLEPLGAGGMGKVFLCEHTLLKKLVAVKILTAEKLNEPSLIERFYREARAIAALNHPNIVRCHDVDKDQKLHYIVMEYVDGVSLQQLVSHNGPLDPIRAAHYVSQTAAGLQHAHEAGWVHRDIKPGNLLVDREGVVKVLDLGLARILMDTGDQLTRDMDDKAVLGTADYLSPEQAMSSHDVDIRADIYSLGATFYFLLCGRPPFADGTVTQKLLWHQIKEPEHIRDIRPELPVALAGMVHRMLAKDPDQRFQVPAELVDALAPWAETLIPPPAETELPQRSAAVQSLQPISGQGTLSNSGAPTSDVRRQRAANGPNSRVRQPGPPSNTAKPPSTARITPEEKPAVGIGKAGRAGRNPILIGGAAAGFVILLAVAAWALWPGGSGPTNTVTAPTNPLPAPPVKPPPTPPAVTTVAPGDAGKFLGKECTVKMRVGSVGADKARFFLNSEKMFKLPINFTVVIDRQDAANFLSGDLDEWRKHFQDRIIHVRGTVVEFSGRPQIRAREAAQIEIIEATP